LEVTSDAATFLGAEVGADLWLSIIVSFGWHCSRSKDEGHNGEERETHFSAVVLIGSLTKYCLDSLGM